MHFFSYFLQTILDTGGKAALQAVCEQPPSTPPPSTAAHQTGAWPLNPNFQYQHFSS